MAQKTVASLSPRELEVARMVAQGLTNREIGEKLFISERTVDGHLEHIREKLGVNTRAQVTAWLVRQETARMGVPATPAPRKRWVIAHPRAWVGAALVLAVLAAGVGVLRLTAPPGPVITTIAGSDCAQSHYPGGCYGGDGERAIEAKLARPTSVAVDSNGVVYIADYGNQRIRKVANGIITTVAGGGKEKLADKVLAVSVSSEPDSPDSLGYVSTIALDRHDQLFLLTNHGGALEVWRIADQVMRFVVTLGPSNSTVRRFGGPNLPVGGLAITKEGVLFIADRAGNRVMKFDGNELSLYAGNGSDAGSLGDGGDARSARLSWPVGLALDRSANLYVADVGDSSVRRVNHAKGTIETVAGIAEFDGDSGDDGRATHALLSFPFGVAVAPDGTVVIADTGNHRLRGIRKDGTIFALAGNGKWGYSGDSTLALVAELHGPEGVVFDSTGDLFVADTENQRVREIPHLSGPE